MSIPCIGLFRLGKNWGITNWSLMTRVPRCRIQLKTSRPSEVSVEIYCPNPIKVDCLMKYLYFCKIFSKKPYLDEFLAKWNEQCLSWLVSILYDETAHWQQQDSRLAIFGSVSSIFIPICKNCKPYLIVNYRLCTSQIEASTSPPGNPRAFEFFAKFLFKFPPPEAEKLFKCPIIGHSRWSNAPTPGNFSVAFIMLRKLCM